MTETAPLSARSARASDARLVYDWRTHASIRATALSEEAFDFTDHQAWFARVLEDPARHLLILEADGQPRAVVRFDGSPEDTYEVSIFVDPDATGMGIGPRALLCAEDWLGAHLDRACSITATVKPENQPSHRLFRKCGYTATTPMTYIKGIDRQ